MKVLRTVPFCLALTFLAAQFASAAEAQPEVNHIKAVLETQIEAWNRGDIPTFVTTYADDCIFVGKRVSQGRDKLLDHYRQSYPNRDSMGHLTFTELAVHVIDPQVALVTAAWHLDRSSRSGGPTGGVFSLVLQQKNGIWKIALDHTS